MNAGCVCVGIEMQIRKIFLLTLLPLSVWGKDQSVNSSLKGYSRYAVNQYASQLVDYNPLSPYRAQRQMTFLSYDRYVSERLSLGILPIYTHARFRYRIIPNQLNENDWGVVPYANFTLNKSWLLTAQAGYNYGRFNYSLVSGKNTIALKQTMDRWFLAAFGTWIGPSQPLTGSIRFGFIQYADLRRSSVDSSGTAYPSKAFLRNGPVLSVRLKFSPVQQWEFAVQAEGEYSTKIPSLESAAASQVYKPVGGRQRTRLTIGPSVSWAINKNVEIKLHYMRVQGFGYLRENQFAIRLKYEGY